MSKGVRERCQISFPPTPPAVVLNLATNYNHLGFLKNFLGTIYM